ncbi:unnamed protein product [Cylindrotheca closterium]|uniref:Uncharacterized protein n=1 Tax=Cylindrotheca closterium TaxID=2856 RepID=A0AAD2PVD2_9STRA|nr:unnamed protein product [Cylindrotheca closterium]
MVLSAQQQRTIKLLTAFSTVGVTVQAVFFSEYHIEGHEGEPHIFSGIQRDAQDWVDRKIYNIDTSKLKAESLQQQQKQRTPPKSS